MLNKKSTTQKIDWTEAFRPLFRKYQRRSHPLEYKNRYQLLVMVILAARDTDRKINALAHTFFAQFPSMNVLAAAEPTNLYPYVKTITSFVKKSKWLVDIARTVKDDSRIPTTMEELTALPGIGRKSANVIMSESGVPMAGVIVDLHVLRVAPRIGVAKGTKPDLIEKQLMEKFPQKHWKELGMSLTHLGREVCRPTEPHFDECPMTPVCNYYTEAGRYGLKK